MSTIIESSNTLTIAERADRKTSQENHENPALQEEQGHGTEQTINSNDSSNLSKKSRLQKETQNTVEAKDQRENNRSATINYDNLNNCINVAMFLICCPITHTHKIPADPVTFSNFHDESEIEKIIKSDFYFRGCTNIKIFSKEEVLKELKLMENYNCTLPLVRPSWGLTDFTCPMIEFDQHNKKQKSITDAQLQCVFFALLIQHAIKLAKHANIPLKFGYHLDGKQIFSEGIVFMDKTEQFIKMVNHYLDNVPFATKQDALRLIDAYTNNLEWVSSKFTSPKIVRHALKAMQFDLIARDLYWRENPRKMFNTFLAAFKTVKEKPQTLISRTVQNSKCGSADGRLTPPLVSLVASFLAPKAKA